MAVMLVRNRVADFAQWKAVFSADAKAHQEAGLKLVNVWRSIEEPNHVFFAFEVASIEKAQEFIDRPESAKAGEAAGVIDGEYHFVEDAGGY